MSSIPLESVHHIEDVGHLLLEAQRDLARVRQRLEAMPLESNSGVDSSMSNDTMDSLRDLLNKTETNLRVKAEAVLKSVEENKLNTLPAVTTQPMRYYGDFHLSSTIVQPENAIVATRSPKGVNALITSPGSLQSPTGGGGGVGGRKQNAILASQQAYMRRPVAERMAEARNLDMLSRPMEPALALGGNGAHEFIQTKFGVASAAGADATAASGGSRPIERYGRNWRDTKLMRGSRAQAHILPKTYRKNPKMFPPISQHDTAHGILNLVERGFIPSFIDVSPAFVSGPAPLQQAPVVFHHHSDQFRYRDQKHQPIAMHDGFNLSQVKLDLGNVILDRHNLNEYEREMLRREEEEKQGALLLENGDGAAHSQQAIMNEGGAALGTTTFDFPRLMPPDPLEDQREKALSLGGYNGVDSDQAFADLLLASTQSGSTALTTNPETEHLDLVPEQRARDYDELLDTYSLHQFLIRKGKTLTGTPEFLSFQRIHTHSWGSVKFVIAALEKVCKDYQIAFATIKGARVIELAEDELIKLTPELLFSCFVIDTTAHSVDPMLLELFKSPTKARYKMGGDVARILAALKIQATYRMFLQRRLYVHYRFQHTKAIRIQRAFRKFRTICQTRARIAEKWTTRLAYWREHVQNPWKATYRSSFSRKKRVLLHIPSLSTEPYQRSSLFNFAVRENTQLSRLCDISDPNVDVIYISPFHLNSDIQNYYLKLLSVGGINNVAQRVKILVPENISRFPEHFSLSKLILYSPKLLKKIKEHLHGRPCAIMANEIGMEDLQLAIELNLPLFGAEPEIQTLFGSKSGSKRIFAAAEISVAPGAHDIYDEVDLYSYLAKLMVDQLHVSRWFLKIDNESGGRGIACLDTQHFKVIHSLREEKTQHANRWNLPEVLANAQERVVVALKKSLAKKVVLACPALYDCKWANFAAAFYRVGGVIEAAPPCVIGSPSVNMMIEPDGEVTLLNSHDQVFSSAFVFSGANFPSSAPADLIHPAALAIGRQCFREGIIGYVGVDFIAWNEGAGATPKVWAVDLNLRITATQASFALFHFLLRGRYSYASGASMKELPVHLRPAARYLVPTNPTNAPAQGSTTVSRSASRANGLTASGASSPSSRMFAGSSPASASSSRDNSRPTSGHTTPKLPGIDAKRSGVQVHAASLSAKDSAPSIAVKEEERFYSTVPYLYQPHLATVQFGSFFNLCRLKGISFDVRARLGTIFMMMDSLASGSIGLLCVGAGNPPATAASITHTSAQPPPSPLHSMQTLVDALFFLNEQVSNLRFGAHIYDAESNLPQMLVAYKGLTKAQREANQLLLMEQNAHPYEHAAPQQ